MEINAIAYLEYWSGESVTGGSERLVLNVKFKEHGKRFRRKLTKSLVSRSDIVLNDFGLADKYNSYDEYYDDVEKYLNDTYLIKMVAENMIKEHFSELNKDNKNEQRKRSVLDKVGKIGKVEIKVEVK